MLTLSYFKVVHKDKVIFDCEFTKYNMSSRENALTSLIIGENASGKSHLLSLIAEFFRSAYKYIELLSSKESIHLSGKLERPTFKYENAIIKYYIEEKSYEIEKIDNDYIARLDGDEIRLQRLMFPKILALSYMVNDKFTFAKPKFFEIYEYMGVRAASNATYTSSIHKKLFTALTNSFLDVKKVKCVTEALNFVGFENKLTIKFRFERKTLFSRGLKLNEIENKIDSFEYNSTVVDVNRVKEIRSEKESIINTLNNLNQISDITPGEIEIFLDFEKMPDKNHLEHMKHVNMLVELKIFQISEVKFYREEYLGFEIISSGEKHILYTLLNMISGIEKSALILIDEPEISLHPSWQMKYIALLKKVLRPYINVHCILASHSHFMVSDLEPNSSTLVSMANENHDGVHRRVCKNIDYDTYAWSAENILYSVFNLRTTRNYYFERDLTALLEIISNKDSDKFDYAKELVANFEKMVFDNKDPINEIISQAKEFLSSVPND